jgi:hypothetical protein
VDAVRDADQEFLDFLGADVGIEPVDRWAPAEGEIALSQPSACPHLVPADFLGESADARDARQTVRFIGAPGSGFPATRIARRG